MRDDHDLPPEAYDDEPGQVQANTLRPPPSCPESESAIIVAAITQRADLDVVIGELETGDFTEPGNRVIFMAAAELHKAQMPVDIPAVQDWLQRNNKTGLVDPIRMQERLMAAPYVSDVEKHIRRVKQHSRLRKLIATCQEIAARGYSAENIEEFITLAESEVYKVAAERSGGRVIHHLRDCVRDLFQSMQAEIEAERDGRAVVARTGLTRLDTLIGGLRNGQLIIIAARPSMGKTALLLNIAANVAGTECTPRLGAHVISLESPRDNVTARTIAAEGRVDVELITQRKIVDWAAMLKAANETAKLPITIDDRSGLTLAQMRASIRRAQAELRKVDEHGRVTQKLGLVCVDYLQLVRHTIKGGNREQEVGAVAQELLNMAREFEVPMVALAQLSRSCESREDKRPLMKDLRESGAIEQAANIIVALYRDDYYDKNSPVKNVAEAIVLKSKDTRTGVVHLRFSPQWMRFDNLADEEYDAVASTQPQRGSGKRYRNRAGGPARPHYSKRRGSDGTRAREGRAAPMASLTATEFEELLASVCATVAVQRDVDALALLSRSRDSRVTKARAMCWRELRKCGCTYMAIGQAFGRDHSTVLRVLRGRARAS